MRTSQFYDQEKHGCKYLNENMILIGSNIIQRWRYNKLDRGDA